MDVHLIPRVIEMCSEAFPHGVALLLYMLEHQIFGFGMIEGDFKNLHVTPGFLCLAMNHGQEFFADDPEAVVELDEMFAEIGRVLRVQQ